jgi:hypothetical protein
MVRFNRPRLITFEDPAYRQHVEQMLLQRANQRALRPPSHRDLFGGEAEELLRAALATRFDLAPRRILEYEERIGQRWQRKYRELDAVIVEDRRVHVFEIKASRRAGALHRAMRQVRDTLSILKLAHLTPSATILFVDTGVLTAAERDSLAASPDAPEPLPQTLQEAIAAYDNLRQVATLDALSSFPSEVELLVLGVDDIVAMAHGAPLSLAWEENDLEAGVAEGTPISTEPIYSTSSADDQEDESPFAAALRKAANKQGQDKK